MLSVVSVENDVVTVESDRGSVKEGFANAILELQSKSALDLAVEEGRKKGLNNHSISGRCSAYPINEDGSVMEPGVDKIPHRYRTEVKLIQRLT